MDQIIGFKADFYYNSCKDIYLSIFVYYAHYLIFNHSIICSASLRIYISTYFDTDAHIFNLEEFFFPFLLAEYYLNDKKEFNACYLYLFFSLLSYFKTFWLIFLSPWLNIQNITFCLKVLYYIL